MTTKQAIQQALKRELQDQGYAIRIDRWPTRATYYKADGEAMPNLPADPWSMQRYLARGFTLVPPGQLAEEAAARQATEEGIQEMLDAQMESAKAMNVETPTDPLEAPDTPHPNLPPQGGQGEQAAPVSRKKTNKEAK